MIDLFKVILGTILLVLGFIVIGIIYLALALSDWMRK